MIIFPLEMHTWLKSSVLFTQHSVEPSHDFLDAKNVVCVSVTKERDGVDSDEQKSKQK